MLFSAAGRTLISAPVRMHVSAVGIRLLVSIGRLRVVATTEQNVLGGCDVFWVKKRR